MGQDWRFTSRKAREELGYASRPLDETLAATIEWYVELIEAGAFDDSRVSGLSRWADSMRIASRLGLLTPLRVGQRVTGRRIVAGGIGHRSAALRIAGCPKCPHPGRTPTAQRGLRGLASARAPARWRHELAGGRPGARAPDRRAARAVRSSFGRARRSSCSGWRRAPTQSCSIAVVAAGHEIGCHGDAHLPVHTQTPAGVRRRPPRGAGHDRGADRTHAGRLPRTRVLDHQGLGLGLPRAGRGGVRLRREPARLAGAPRPGRAVDGRAAPLDVDGDGLWEFPVAVWRIGRAAADPGRRRLVLAGAADPGDPPRARREPVRSPASTCTRTSSTPSRCARSSRRPPPPRNEPTPGCARPSATAPAGAPRGPQGDRAAVRADPLW